MKKRSVFANIQPNGILRWSTALLLAGSAVSLTSCDEKKSDWGDDSSTTALRAKNAASDAQREMLQRGEVSNNFNIPGVGYYHAAKNNFFEHPYNFERDGKYYINGEWQTERGADITEASRPSPEALKKVDGALEREQQTAGTGNTTNYYNQNHGGSGIGNMLMMYWLLSGNRGSYAPGPGFSSASRNANAWQNSVEEERRRTTTRPSSGGTSGGGSSYGYRSGSSSGSYESGGSSSSRSGSSYSSGSSTRGGFGSSSGGHSFGG